MEVARKELPARLDPLRTSAATLVIRWVVWALAAHVVAGTVKRSAAMSQTCWQAASDMPAPACGELGHGILDPEV